MNISFDIVQKTSNFTFSGVLGFHSLVAKLVMNFNYIIA